MVKVKFEDVLERKLKKVKDALIKRKLKSSIKKIIENPQIGKPMMYQRKGTREVYITQFRLSYVYLREQNLIIFLDLYHKDEQ